MSFSSERKKGRELRDSLVVCAHVFTLCSHKGVSLRRIRSVLVKGWLVMGRPSPSVVIRIALESAVDIGFTDQISGLPRGCRSAATSAVMVRAMMKGHSGVPPL